MITLGLLVRLARHLGNREPAQPRRTGGADGHQRQPPGRAFKQSTGATIGDHLRQGQFERARALLADSDLSLGEIATRLGFASQYGFTLAFRRQAEETPSAYRKRTRIRLSA